MNDLNDLIETIRRVLADGPPLRLAVLFGSFATGRARLDSDVDIAILPYKDVALSVELDLAAQLSRVLAREVDLVRIDRASTLVQWQIARDGVLIFAEPTHEWIRFRARVASEHAAMAEPLRRAAELFMRRIARPPT